MSYSDAVSVPPQSYWHGYIEVPKVVVVLCGVVVRNVVPNPVVVLSVLSRDVDGSVELGLVVTGSVENKNAFFCVNGIPCDI